MTTNEQDRFELQARALLAKLVGQVAATLFLGCVEEREGAPDLVLHARHRKGRILVKAWSGRAQFKGSLAKPYRDEDFVALVVRCAAKVSRATGVAYRELRAREDAGLERAMRDRLARRDFARERARAERARPPGLIDRLLQLVRLR